MAQQTRDYVAYEPVQIIEASNHKEVKTRWCQYMAGIAASMSLMTSGAWFGWATPLLPLLLGPQSPVPMTRDEASWMVASIEVGCLLSPFPSVFFADRYGRKLCMLISTPFFFVSLLLTIFIKSVVSLCVARVLQGIALCIPYSVLPLYLGEISSPEARGRVTSFFHIFWSLGCLFPYCVGPYLSYDSLTYATFGTTVLFVLCFAWQPESPYFYAMRGNEFELNKALLRLRDSSTEQTIAKEREDIILEVKKSMEMKLHWYDIIATPTDRKALLLLVIVGIISFLSGQNAILSYTTETFSSLGDNGLLSPDQITIGVGIIAFFGSIFSIFTSDRYGRRFLLLISSIGCFLSLFVASVFFYIETHTTVDLRSFLWISPVAVMAYNLFVTAGMHPVCVTYTSELFPTKTRGLAASISNTNLTLCSFLVLKTYETISMAMGGVYFIYFCYGLICLVGTILFYFMMPETKGKTFLQIREDLVRSQN